MLQGRFMMRKSYHPIHVYLYLLKVYIFLFFATDCAMHLDQFVFVLDKLHLLFEMNLYKPKYDFNSE